MKKKPIVSPGWRVSNVGRLMGGQVHTAQTPKSLAPPENIPNILSLSLWNIVRLLHLLKAHPVWVTQSTVQGMDIGHCQFVFSDSSPGIQTDSGGPNLWIFSDGAQKGKLHLTIFKKLHLQGYLVYHLSVTLLVQLLHLSVPSISHEMFHNTSICGQSDDFIQLIT